MTPFDLPWDNADIDIHPDPPEGWHRVVVACGWQDAKVARKRWPHAAVVGPLRTVRGIDLLVRALLANPQVRVLVWDGPDLTPGEATKTELQRYFPLSGPSAMQSIDLAQDEYAEYALGLVRAAAASVLPHHDPITGDAVGVWPWWAPPHDFELALADRGLDRDRVVQMVLPPPPPAPTTRAPHGDPGERVVGDTLADIWPQLLQRTLTCGREIPTHYGATRELLSVFSVIRDPVATLDSFGSTATTPGPEGPGDTIAFNSPPHPVLGFTWAELEDYYRRLTTDVVPEGAAYSYGSRLAGNVQSLGQAVEVGVRRALAPWMSDPLDQFAFLYQGLKAEPLYRGHFLTPWRAYQDAVVGKSGRPCLVGVQFRAVPLPACETCGGGGVVSAGPCPFCGGRRPEHQLHAQVVFRSHDLYGAYSLNLAAVCMWLVNTAMRHRMGVGTVSCLSVSGHVYERDWAAAQEVIEAYKPPTVRWDQRTSWRIEKVALPQPWPKVGDTVHYVAQMAGEDYSGTWRILRYDHYEDGSVLGVRLEPIDVHPEHDIECFSTTDLTLIEPRPVYELGATALTPDGSEVVATFEAPNPGNLRLQLERSGLVTGTGAALWLGAEIERVWRNG